MKTGELVHHLRVLDCEQCYLCRECKDPHKLKCFLFVEAADTLEAQQKRIKELEAGRAKPLTAFLSPIDAYKGLKRKFLVFKSDTGEMVENCFVLCPGNDPAAVEALRAYARATNNATLSADIVNWVGEGEERRWIPVTERLPESGVRVIVCRGDKVEQGVFLGVNGWWKVYGTNTKKVTHWMPLPEPPKEV